MHTRIGSARRPGEQSVLAAVLVGLILLALILTGCDLGSGNTSSASATNTPTALPPALVRGEELFARYCQVCHPGGQQGVGARLIGIPLTDDQIKTVVRHGQKNMPAFTAETVPDEDLQSLVDYIRSLK
jgi:mono/diheme cytochrome c family protein